MVFCCFDQSTYEDEAVSTIVENEKVKRHDNTDNRKIVSGKSCWGRMRKRVVHVDLYMTVS